MTSFDSGPLQDGPEEAREADSRQCGCRTIPVTKEALFQGVPEHTRSRGEVEEKGQEEQASERLKESYLRPENQQGQSEHAPNVQRDRQCRVL